MPFITWDDSIRTMIHTIDEDHKKLINKINELYDELVAGQTKARLLKVMDELMELTKDHFILEEALFAKTNYPESYKHKLVHEALLLQGMASIKKFKESDAQQLTMAEMNALRDWIVIHIKGPDMRYVQHFKSKGII